MSMGLVSILTSLLSEYPSNNAIVSSSLFTLSGIFGSDVESLKRALEKDLFLEHLAKVVQQQPLDLSTVDLMFDWTLLCSNMCLCLSSLLAANPSVLVQHEELMKQMVGKLVQVVRRMEQQQTFEDVSKNSDEEDHLDATLCRRKILLEITALVRGIVAAASSVDKSPLWFFADIPLLKDMGLWISWVEQQVARSPLPPMVANPSSLAAVAENELVKEEQNAWNIFEQDIELLRRWWIEQQRVKESPEVR
jgi:hypothetical protein